MKSKMKFEKQIEEIRKSGLFNDNYYLQRYPEVAKAGLNPLVHYLEKGWEEGKNPSENFNTEYYLERYPDVSASKLNPLIHYIRHGKNREAKARYFLSVTATVRNEGKYLDEWLCYYIYHGVEHFYLHNDKSTDETKEVLRPYIEKGYITLYENLRDKEMLQHEYYELVLKERRFETEWSFFVDADEFYQGKQKMAPFLKSLDDSISGVEIYWKNYGDSGIEKYDNRLVIDRFTYHCTLAYAGADMVKSVCKMIRLNGPGVHLASYKKGEVLRMRKDKWGKFWLNHYQSKTREEYEARVRLGNACSKDGMGRGHHFNHVNQNEIFNDSMRVYVKPVKEIIFNLTGRRIEESKHIEKSKQFKLDTTFHPHMTDQELHFFTELAKKSTNYLEFGSGGTSIYAAYLVKGRVVSVDSDKEWQEKIVKACLDLHLLVPHFRHVNIGKLGPWGYPADEREKGWWPNYHKKVWEVKEAHFADLVLVDGRFRVACFLSALLHCSTGTIFMIHDFERSEYKIIQEFAEHVGTTGRLSAFRKTEDFDSKAVMEALAKYEHDPR